MSFIKKKILLTFNLLLQKQSSSQTNEMHSSLIWPLNITNDNAKGAQMANIVLR